MEDFEIEVVHVKANPQSQLDLSEWTIEETQDLMAYHSIDVERWLMYPDGAPWHIKLLWFIEDSWYKVTGR
jgi:hypothetical protein